MQRSTKQRAAIDSVLRHIGRPLSPQEILSLAQRQLPSLGIATVYRAIKQMEQEKLIKEVHLPGRPPLYEAGHLDHHHHFQCKVCSKVFDFEGCPGNLAEFAPSGFLVESHEITLYGVCADCLKSNKKDTKHCVLPTSS
ncbi:Fur family transcriptional regulator [Comamonas kerstersii]|uniref:Fur family transcriptional regulator n=1 Tax=Comamonas kerstersii TaxID=225992 RepID=UPI001B33E128|nr:transcriptional repressor [Comamonas kerstersii]QTW19998.1 transcriptional repressor [Comamonas kerstersii]